MHVATILGRPAGIMDELPSAAQLQGSMHGLNLGASRAHHTNGPLTKRLPAEGQNFNSLTRRIVNQTTEFCLFCMFIDLVVALEN